MCNAILRRVRATIVVVGKSISITYSKRVFVALVIQHAKRVRQILIRGLSCSNIYIYIYIYIYNIIS